MYLNATRSDLMYVVSLISKFITSPTELQLQVTKKVLRCLKGTIDLGVLRRKKGNGELIAYTNSDYTEDIDDRKNTLVMCFYSVKELCLGPPKKQPLVTLSTTKAEYVAVSSCACQWVWMRRVLEKLGHF